MTPKTGFKHKTLNIPENMYTEIMEYRNSIQDKITKKIPSQEETILWLIKYGLDAVKER